MKNMLTVLGLSAALGGCVTTTPPTAVHQPMTARPEARADNGAVGGAIFNVASARPLFEDRRARFVGDTLTINIVEKVQASKKSDTKAERSHEVDFGIPLMNGLPFKRAQNMTLEASSGNKFTGKGENASSNNFTGTNTETVTPVRAGEGNDGGEVSV